MNLPEKVREKLRDVPDAPGCYIMRDRHGRIIYVGRAVSLRKRVQTYFRDATLRSGDAKLRSLVKSVHDIEFITTRSDAEAALLEAQLIKDYKPRYNVSFKDDKRFLLLKAWPDVPFPVFKLCRIKRDDGALYFGPYVSSGAVRATLDFVEKKFGLRKCDPKVPDKDTYKHCINDVVRYCSAPCVGKVSREEYAARFEEACGFLRGELPGYLKELAEAMEAAAGEMDFERAAALRDTLMLLRRAVQQRATIVSTPEMKRQNALRGVGELKSILGMKRAPMTMEAYDVSNISGTHAVGSMVCFVEGMPCKNRYRRFRIRTVEGSDDPRMMAEVIRRRFKSLADRAGAPDLVLVDGGATQLRSARVEMNRLGFDDIPAVGLAKRFEELHRRDGPPVRLPADSCALKMLQRLRDEAHRFALTYHQKLRSRRIRESSLDDIPGIGKKRKRVILEHFGSVRRLMRADEKAIAAVPGIGPGMAAQIHEALHKGKKR